MENVWLNCLIFHLCSIINFFSRRHFLQEILSRLLEKTKQFYVLSRLVECHSTIISFDFQMSKGAYDVFALVINFLGRDWQPKHIIINLFEAT